MDKTLLPRLIHFFYEKHLIVETQLGAFCSTIFGSIDFCRIMVYDEEKCIVWEKIIWMYKFFQMSAK